MSAIYPLLFTCFFSSLFILTSLDCTSLWFRPRNRSVCLPRSSFSFFFFSWLHLSHYSRFSGVRFTSDSLSFIPLPHSPPKRDTILSVFLPPSINFLWAVQTTPLSSLFRLMPCFHVVSFLCFYCRVLKVESQRQCNNRSCVLCSPWPSASGKR